MNDESLEAYVACRLIPLDKKPGVRPIGVGEVLRRIIGKSIISVIKPEILESAGSLHLCAGLPGGCEAAAHAMTTIFEEEEDALLLLDARMPSTLLIERYCSTTFVIYVQLCRRTYGIAMVHHQDCL